jgi:signal recognition particle receptor subunit beta
MALFDPERKRIVVRVVYDGPGHAGKTTNLRHLCKSFASWRRSEMVSPNTLGERTQYFDWLEVDGGLLRSFPIRAQLLTVPGQTELVLRRQFVIERADVVVFVADSQPESVAESRRFYAQLCEQLEGFEHRVPIIFVANKQDLAGALRPPVVAKQVCGGLRAPAAVKGTVATSNRGVKQALMVALRLCSEELRDRWRGEDPKGKVGDVGDAETTLAALEHHEAQLARGRPSTLRPTLPSPDLPTTQIWPAVSGRALIGELYGQRLIPRPDAAHPERTDLEVDLGGERWRLSTSSDRLFEDLDAAQAALHQLSSRKVALGSWLAEPCAVTAVADPEGRGAWLWAIDPVLPSLEDALARTRPGELPSEAAERRRDAMLRFVEAALGAEALAERRGLVVELEPGSFAVQRDEARTWTRYLGHELAAGDAVDVAGPLLALARRFANDEVALADFTEVLCLGLYRVPEAPERRAALRQAFAELELAEAELRRIRDAASMVLGRPAVDAAVRS